MLQVGSVQRDESEHVMRLEKHERHHKFDTVVTPPTGGS
jgi:hypothetical protein